MRAMDFLESRNRAGLIMFSCVLTCFCCFAEEKEPEMPSEDESGGTWTLLDTAEATDAYRSKRHRLAVEGLAPLPLSAAHRALLANAVAKMYSGTPVSSFSVMTREELPDEEPSESTSNWLIDETGRIRNANETAKKEQIPAGPFQEIPPVPVVVSNASIVGESDSAVTFSFDVPKEDAELRLDSNAMETLEVFHKGTWSQEITVDKVDQAPIRFVAMKLAKPVRKRFVYKFDTMKLEYHFSYKENCGVHAVSKSTFEMRGSVIGMGKLLVSKETKFTDIECEEPLRFLVKSD